MNVAIVEDDIKSAELLKTCLQKYGAEKDIKFDIVHFTSGEEFIEKYRRAIYSIVFPRHLIISSVRFLGWSQTALQLE